MKKIIALALVLVLAFAIVGCSGGSDGDLKLGMGVKTSISKSADLAENDDGEMVGLAQVDTVIAAVSVDGDGKVVSVSIDTAQTRVNFDEAGVITSDREAEYKTKKELGSDYGMIKASGIGREWDEQIAAVEEWMVGKTATEISNMPVEDGYPTDVDLVTKATLNVSDYIAVVLEAIENAE